MISQILSEANFPNQVLAYPSVPADFKGLYLTWDGSQELGNTWDLVEDIKGYTYWNSQSPIIPRKGSLAHLNFGIF